MIEEERRRWPDQWKAAIRSEAADYRETELVRGCEEGAELQAGTELRAELRGRRGAGGYTH